MNTRILLSTLALATVAVSGLARADDADGSQFAIKFEGSRTRAEVAAEAATVARTRSTEPAGSRVIQAPSSSLQAQDVRAQAVEALRLGKIPSGERSF
jgi:hypothetical protein